MSPHDSNAVEARDPGIVIVLSLFTCGFYLLYWYYRMYEEMTWLTGRTPTGSSYGLDLLLTIVSCGLYGVWVDYQLSVQLNEEQTRRGVQGASDTVTASIVLDVAAYVTGFFTNYVTSAIHQQQLNKIMQTIRETKPA